MNDKINKLQKVNHEASDSNRYVVTYLRGENKGKKSLDQLLQNLV